MAINTFSGGNPINSLQAAGKNKIINGDFGIWQRGTSFSNPANGAYTTDRFLVAWDGTGATRTISQQTFTPGTAPVSGYEGTYYYRWAQSVAGTETLNQIIHKIEDVRTLAGQAVTVSFWAKAAANRSIGVYLGQRFGTGGSAYVGVISSTASLTTSWQRFTFTATAPSLTGKTIGTDSNLELLLDLGVTTFTIDLWGVQVEQGNTATTFTTASGGSPQGELAMCQRYYYRSSSADSQYQTHATGFCWSSTNAMVFHRVPVTMRIAPTSLEYGNLLMLDSAFGGGGTQTLVFASTENSSNMVQIMTSNATGFTAYRPVYLRNNNTTAGYIAFSAEL